MARSGRPTSSFPGIVYGIGDDIGHPRTDEFNLSFETQLTRTLRFTATGIWRWSDSFINNVIDESRWAPVTLTNQLTNQTFTGYQWANSDTTDENFFIRNTEGFQYIATDGSVIATADPRRNYKGLMLLLSSSLRNRFGYQVSYVLSKAEGNVDNNVFGPYLQGTTWNSPNTAIINNFGELTNSRRHELKAYVSYQVPRVDVLLGMTYFGMSGRPFTPFQQYSAGQLNLPSAGRRQILLETRGSRIERLLQPGRSPGGEGVQVRGEPIRCLCRHPESVQHRHRVDPSGQGSEHDHLGRDGQFPGAADRADRSADHVRRSLVVLTKCWSL